jgi:hypothetical protein
MHIKKARQAGLFLMLCVLTGVRLHWLPERKNIKKAARNEQLFLGRKQNRFT